jgi:hypothetical protein
MTGAVRRWPVWVVEKVGLVKSACWSHAMQMATTVTVNDILDGHVSLDVECLELV